MYYIKMRPIEIKSDTTANVVCLQVPVRFRVPYPNKFPLASRRGSPTRCSISAPLLCFALTFCIIMKITYYHSYVDFSFV